ncbi:MAG: type II toxin-antitoxin system RelE/ParE family toxin [Sediminibacterium sp.]
MANYILSNKAIEDLSNIWNYTFDTWSEKQADKYYTVLVETCQDLATAKAIGKPYPDIDEKILGYRIGQHIIFFLPLIKGKIEIVRILHSSMDLKNRILE